MGRWRFSRITIAFVTSLSLLMIFLLGCSGENEKKQEMIEIQLSLLFETKFDVDYTSPTMWIDDIENYIDGDFEHLDGLEKRLDDANVCYENIIEYLTRSVDNELDLEVWEELSLLREYIFLGANYLKIARDLLEKDIEEKNSSSLEIISEIGNFYNNNYASLFMEEYRRIADEYDIETGSVEQE